MFSVAGPTDDLAGATPVRGRQDDRHPPRMEAARESGELSRYGSRP